MPHWANWANFRSPNGVSDVGGKQVVPISLVHGDLLAHPSDLLVLKHADGFYGVDKTVARLVAFDGHVREDTFDAAFGRNAIAAKKVLFVGVGPLGEFGYSQIRKFGKRALAFSKQTTPEATVISMPIHGPGYGLDDVEAFCSLVAGLVDAFDEGIYPSNLQRVDIVEKNVARAARFRQLLTSTLGKGPPPSVDAGVSPVPTTWVPSSEVRRALDSFGVKSERKPKLFVAMPFKEELTDEWEISIQEAGHASNILCERVDKTAFVGDISLEVRRRIEEYDGLIAVLNGANPNVFLEIGYAWAKSKPIVLVAKEGQDLPFDVKGQRCIFYKGIADLRAKLRSELNSLRDAGIFGGKR